MSADTHKVLMGNRYKAHTGSNPVHTPNQKTIKMKNYTKKPVTIQAIQYNGQNLDEIKEFVGNKLMYNDAVGYFISTLEGEMLLSVNDYVIRGLKGEFYPCREDIFEMSYDLSENVTDDKIESNKYLSITIEDKDAKFVVKNISHMELIGILRYHLLLVEKEFLEINH